MERTRTNTDRDQFKPDQYLIASDAIGFGMDPIYFEAPACRFVSIWHRFGLARIGIQPATPGFGSFRYHFKSKRYRFNSNRYRNDRKELPLKSINSRDTGFFDIVSTQSHITLTESDVVLSHPEISWSRQPFAPGLWQFIPLWKTFVFRPFRYLSVPDRCVVVTDTTFFAPIRWGPAPRKPSKRCRRVTLNNNNSTMNHFNQKEVPMTQKVIVLTGFAKLSDAEALATAGAVIKGIYVDKVFAAPPPFDEATLRTSVDDLTGSIATQAQAGGGTTVTTVKNKKRDVLDGLLRKLAHYVQANCNDDVQVVLNSGFQAKTTAVRSQVPLAKAKIVSVDNGHTKELVVRAQKIPRARSYEVQAAAVGANNTVGSFQPAGIFTKSRSMTVTGLTPGTIYAIQVRALGGSTGSGDWSDVVTHMCM